MYMLEKHACRQLQHVQCYMYIHVDHQSTQRQGLWSREHNLISIFVTVSHSPLKHIFSLCHVLYTCCFMYLEDVSVVLAHEPDEVADIRLVLFRALQTGTGTQHHQSQRRDKLQQIKERKKKERKKERNGKKSIKERESTFRIPGYTTTRLIIYFIHVRTTS